MSSALTATPSGKGLNILIIHAANCPPDEASLGALLDAAGLVVGSVTLATPADISSGAIDPRDFDHVIALLDDDLTEDDQLAAGMLGIARCGMGVIGIWGDGAETEDMHPALRKFGAKQIPWDAEQLLQALGTNAPQAFKSTSGGRAAKHETTHNKC